MIFRVCEHYYYDDEQYNECFICFEYITDNENKPINLQKQQLYVNNCCCDVAVHTCCLKKWFNIYKSCPICRIVVVENNTNLYNYISYGIKIYIFIQIITIRILKVLITILFLYTLVDFHFLLLRNNIYNDYNYNQSSPHLL